MLGSNVPTIGGLINGFKYAEDWGCDCMQVYITLSRRWDVPELSNEEILDFKTAWNNSNVKEVIAHVPLLVNLASVDNDVRCKSIVRLSNELKRANQLGVRILVLHPGFWRGTDRNAGIRRVTDALNAVFENTGDFTSIVALETMAGQQGAIGSRFEEIATIIENVYRSELIGVCFDIAHVFISGYPMSDYEEYEATLKRFNNIVGTEKIKVFHVSDAKTMPGSKRDRHASIGEGYIGLKAFHSLVRDRRFINVPKILEIPERDEKSKDNLDILRNLQDSDNQLFEVEKPRQLVLGDLQK